MTTFTQVSDIICMQELSNAWKEDLDDAILTTAGWSAVGPDDSGEKEDIDIGTWVFFNAGDQLAKILQCHWLPMLPPSTEYTGAKWRRYLTVSRLSCLQALLLCANSASTAFCYYCAQALCVA